MCTSANVGEKKAFMSSVSRRYALSRDHLRGPFIRHIGHTMASHTREIVVASASFSWTL